MAKITFDQLNALEEWFISIIKDQNSIHVEDAIYRTACYNDVLIEFGLKDREND